MFVDAHANAKMLTAPQQEKNYLKHVTDNQTRCPWRRGGRTESHIPVLCSATSDRLEEQPETSKWSLPVQEQRWLPAGGK